MRYSVKQYAAALGVTLKGKSPQERKEIIRRFLFLLRKQRASSRLGLIVHAVGRQELKAAGLKKISVISAAPLAKRIKTEIEQTLGKNLMWQESVDPGALAGMKIFVDDDILVDATGKKQIERLFPV